MKRLLPLFLFLFFSTGTFSQDLSAITITVSEPKNLTEVFTEVEEQHRLKFFYLDEWLQFEKVEVTDSGQSLKSLLDGVVAGSDLSYVFMFGYAVIFSKDPATAIQREALLRDAVAGRKKIQEITLGERRDLTPGKQVQIRGRVTSETDGSILAGATIFVSDLNAATSTDAGGNYSLTIPAGSHVLQYQHLNYAETIIDLTAYASGKIDIVLQETPTILQEVEVTDQAIVTRRISESSLSMREIKRAPAFLGEVDVIKNLQVQSGVTTVGEVASGFNVRGGGVDQNLVLYDGMPVFNTAHALGFFTAFNSEVINNVSFYRGGIPAEFGGRVSSVLNITSREGDYRKIHGSGGIGIISSHLSLGGPIRKDSTSFQISARSSYSNWMLDAIKSTYADLSNSSVAFYDGSAKVTHKFSRRTKLTLAGYASHDEFSLADDTLYSWQNRTASVRVDHTHSERLFSTVTAGIGQYQYKFEDDDPESAFDLRYSILYPSLKIDFNHNGPHALAFGFHNTFYSFNPGVLRPKGSESQIRGVEMPHERALETALYFSDGFFVSKDFFIEAGLRYALYNRIGPGRVYAYAPGVPREPHTTTDSTIYGSGEVMKTYHGPEPRLSLRYEFGDHSSVKVGYNRIYQFLHLITNTAAVTPVDVWQSSNNYFKPQIAQQVSAGYYRNFRDNAIEAFAEVFYKRIQNILEFKDGADLILNPQLETALLSGRGRAYGMELSAAKIKGRLQGFINYTYSRSLRTVNGTHEREKVNRGKEYPSNYDQPHVTNVNWRYGISRRHFFSGTFTYHMGRPMSVPRSGFTVDNIPILDFSERNTFRIPDYHRLDVAFIIEGNHKLKKAWDGTWVISFYNVYARRNAYSVYYRRDGFGLSPYQLSVIGTIVPTVTYTFKF